MGKEWMGLVTVLGGGVEAEGEWRVMGGDERGEKGSRETVEEEEKLEY